MEENLAKNPEDNQNYNELPDEDVPMLSDAEVAELNAAFASQDENQTIDAEKVLTDILTEEVEKPEIKEVKFRHPQQLLTNKEIQILIEKQALVEQARAEKEKNGEDPDTVEDLNPTEKGAISLYLLRARHHNSRPKLLSSKKRKALKKKRKISKNSRKANRR